MSGKKRVLLTLEERLKLAAGSQAVSPETAVKLVQRLSQLGTENLFCGRRDLDAMYELVGESMDDPDMGVEYYSGFCRCVQLAIFQADELFQQTSLESEIDPYRPLWGAKVNNAIVLLGLMLLDHAKNRMPGKDIYHCTRMTLGQYLDALEELDSSCPIWRDNLLRGCGCDGSEPLGDALEGILNRYVDGWQVFDHLEHILRCMDGLACYLEREEESAPARRFREALRRYAPDLNGQDLAEADVRYLDPNGYFFTLANEYPGERPDLGGDIPPETVRGQILLPQRNYHPAALQGLASLSPSPELRELLERNIDEERIASAMQELNLAVDHLYLLWVEPYLRVERS